MPGPARRLLADASALICFLWLVLLAGVNVVLGVSCLFLAYLLASDGVYFVAAVMVAIGVLVAAHGLHLLYVMLRRPS